MKTKAISSPLLLLLCSGCGSLLVSHNASAGPYPGARTDAHFIAHPSADINFGAHGEPPPDKEQTRNPYAPVVISLALVDLPFSAALDTLLLPWDLWYPAE
jgi:uncharacterized protein YceK